jgi:GNAT superfamily N-acetyltransferase
VRRGVSPGIELDDDRARIDVASVHGYVSQHAYWALGRSYEEMQHLIDDAARVVGLYDHDRQIGFCRVASDDTTYAWLFDVYVLHAYRGRGLGVELVREAVENGPQRTCAGSCTPGTCTGVCALRLRGTRRALHGTAPRRLIDSPDDVRTSTPPS